MMQINFFCDFRNILTIKILSQNREKNKATDYVCKSVIFANEIRLFQSKLEVVETNEVEHQIESVFTVSFD